MAFNRGNNENKTEIDANGAADYTVFRHIPGNGHACPTPRAR